MVNNLFLVVCYANDNLDFETLNCFKDYNFSQNDKIIIWNNGPDFLDANSIRSLEKFHINIELVNYLKNASLGGVYNYFLCKDFNRIIFLDNDSKLTSNYFDSISSIDHIGFPKIISNKQTYPVYPVYSKFSKLRITTITSGIVINKEIINILSSRLTHVFSNDLHIYGIDTDFCLKLYKTKLSKLVENMPPISHSLSRLESKNNDKFSFLGIERSRELGVNARNHFSLSFMFLLIKFFFFPKSYKYDVTYNRREMIKSFISGSNISNSVVNPEFIKIEVIKRYDKN